VKTSLREVLADSHIAAVAIALLLVGALGSAASGIWSVLLPTINFLAYAVATLDIPYLSDAISQAGRVDLALKMLYFFYALMGLCAALILSRWIYGVGPIRCLAQYRTGPKKGSHV